MSTKRGSRPRPTKLSDKTLAEISARLSEGEPLAVICRDAHMPCPDTVRDWMSKYDYVARAIARARVDGHDAIAARLRLTARGLAGGESSGDVHRDKLIIETDLKLLAKWDPKRYGDRLDHTSSDGTMTPRPAVDLSKLSSAALREIINASESGGNERSGGGGT